MPYHISYNDGTVTHIHEYKLATTTTVPSPQVVLYCDCGDVVVTNPRLVDLGNRVKQDIATGEGA